MNGSIESYILHNKCDANGKKRVNVKAYLVRYDYRDPLTGTIKRKKKRGFLRRSDAECFLLKVNEEQQDGTFTAENKITLGAYLERWLVEYVKINTKESTYHQYDKIVHKRLIPWAGGFELRKITSKHIDDFYAKLLTSGRVNGKGGLSEKTVLYIHRVLNEALKHAVKKQLIGRNPVDGINNVPKPKKYKASIYSPSDMLNLLSEAMKERTKLWVTAIALAGLCGMRRGECLGLRWSKVDFENRTITIDEQLVEVGVVVKFSSPKSAESNRCISAPPEVFSILRERLNEVNKHRAWLGNKYDDNDLVLCHDDGTAIRPRLLTNSFADFLNRHHLRKIRFHDLRHSCASMMLEAGVALKTISDMLGHSSITITADLYTHVQEETKKKAADKLSDLVFNKKSSEDKN